MSKTLKSIIPTRQRKLTAVYQSSTVAIQTVSSSNKEEYLSIFSDSDVRKYREQGYRGLHLGAIRLGLQPTFLVGKNVTCFLALLDTRWNNFENALITAVEVGLHNGHVIIEVEPNFSLDLTKESLSDTIQVMIQLNGATMRASETTIALHHTMMYKVQCLICFQ